MQQDSQQVISKQQHRLVTVPNVDNEEKNWPKLKMIHNCRTLCRKFTIIQKRDLFTNIWTFFPFQECDLFTEMWHFTDNWPFCGIVISFQNFGLHAARWPLYKVICAEMWPLYRMRSLQEYGLFTAMWPVQKCGFFTEWGLRRNMASLWQCDLCRNVASLQNEVFAGIWPLYGNVTCAEMWPLYSNVTCAEMWPPYRNEVFAGTWPLHTNVAPLPKYGLFTDCTVFETG